MSLYSERPARLVIPRWRNFKTTSKSKELAKEKNKNSPIIPELSIQKRIDNWEKDKSAVNAIELVNSAFIADNKNAALEAAHFIVQNCKDEKHLSLQISKAIIDDNYTINPESSIVKFDELTSRIGSRIREIREKLKIFPNNPIQWVDLARLFSVIGKVYQAERCIRTAIQLSSNNVFIIRSAVRFFIHKGDDEGLSYALKLIRKNPATKLDPWLMATEISLCSYLKKSSDLIKTGVSLIDSKNFNPFVISELSSAIATEEMNHGKNKSARKFFSSSLIDPNENSLAQAEWATNNIDGININLTKNINSFEANSYNYYNQEKWEDSLNESLNWIVDQPFSSEPASHASYLAGALVDDHDLSIRICDFGLIANPHEFTLLNNKAYSLAMQCKTDAAEKIFDQIDFNMLSEGEQVTYLATKGMINYRQGNKEAGSALYDEAEILAGKRKDQINAMKIKIYKMKAELICGYNIEKNQAAIDFLINSVEKINRPDIKKAILNLKTLIKMPNTNPALQV